MREMNILCHGRLAGKLIEIAPNRSYVFEYDKDYKGPPISLTMPRENLRHEFNQFPPCFEGLLPEGFQLEALLRFTKLEQTDYFSQLLALGGDLVGAISVEKTSL